MNAVQTSVDAKILAERAQSHEAEMVQFLRDLIAIPAESSQEGPVIARIRWATSSAASDRARPSS